MNIDLILTEWCYRLPKGYPTISKDYEVLYDVLLEVAKISVDDARQIVERAKGNTKQVISESIQFDSIENQLLRNAISEAGKSEQFRTFLNLLPTEADAATLKFLNNMQQEQCNEFAEEGESGLLVYKTANDIPAKVPDQVPTSSSNHAQ